MSRSRDPGRPNVLLVCTDQWSGRVLGAAGHPSVRTPTLDTLAAAGVRYTRAYAESPVCIPARRSLMTGTSPRVHGDRTFETRMRMPDVPTIADAFKTYGYQAFAVGKLHVYPQRDRIGFDDVVLSEEGRRRWGLVDDYDDFLTAAGFSGQRFAHGMSNNQYTWRPWHLPEAVHETRWASQQMARVIKRRDPTRPGFWYLSFSAPHPPLTPPRDYLDMIDPAATTKPVMAAWAQGDDLPHQMKRRHAQSTPVGLDDVAVREARRAYYAQCTYIDHQLRQVIGTLREEGILDQTIIAVTADHGDMLGDHGLWGKRVFYEGSANIPLIISDGHGETRLGRGVVDDRPVGLQDVMPSLLDLAGLPIPATVEGRSVLGSRTSWRSHLYGEYGAGGEATRMVHDGRFKLIYYPVGNRSQLFDLDDDPHELDDLATVPEHIEMRRTLEAVLIERLYGGDEAWAGPDGLVGLPDAPLEHVVDRSLGLQRGLH